ncbi:MAG: signal peptidase II [Ignavibacteria bacterium]|jgi:signal peptidase II|nr:signal peptidase II [Ignavibacteria bacterium]MDH7528878.1 signal peptidase II [Ignavibacteria bacterium]
MKVLYYSLIVIILDQATKLLVKGFKIPFLNFHHRGLKINSSIKVWDDIIQITHVENYGLAFGIDFGREFKVVLTIFTIIAALLILYYLYVSRYKDFKIRLAIALIFGGAMGNIIDRTFYGVLYGYAPLLHGRVVDFIHIDFFDYSLFGRTYQSLPIFNLADVAVLAGIIMLLYISFKSKLQRDLSEQSTSEEASTSDSIQSNTEQEKENENSSDAQNY